MALFDKLKELQYDYSSMQSASDESFAESRADDGLDGAVCTEISIDSLPTSLIEFQDMNTSKFRDPNQVVALTVVALSVYPYKKELAIEMLNYLKGPQALSPYELHFLRDRLRGKDYLPSSYFVGASPENDYTPKSPSFINVYKTPRSEDMLSEGYIQLFLKSGGADTARPVRLRYKPSTKEWFLWEYFLLAGIRQPKSADPWA